MKEFYITQDELDNARSFFSDSSIELLTSQSIKINTSQPNFSTVVLALERDGLDRPTVEDLLESIFVIYFAQTTLRGQKINQISFGQILKNVKWFESFIKYYNKEKEFGSDNLSEIKFVRDEVVLKFALNTLKNLFGDISSSPKVVIFSYFAVLKAIEIGVEKN